MDGLWVGDGTRALRCRAAGTARAMRFNLDENWASGDAPYSTRPAATSPNGGWGST